jgi:hypothetical protein
MLGDNLNWWDLEAVAIEPTSRVFRLRSILYSTNYKKVKAWREDREKVRCRLTFPIADETQAA